MRLTPRYRADLLPKTCDSREVPTDLLEEFVAEHDRAAGLNGKFKPWQ